MRILYAAGVVALIATPALADPMANAYGNTVVVTSASGDVSKQHYSEDQTITTTLPDGSVVKGTWELTDGESKICVTQTDPAPAPDAPQPACTAFLGSLEVGEGETAMTVEIVAGR